MTQFRRRLGSLAITAALAAGQASATQVDPGAGAKATASGNLSGVTVTPLPKPSPLVNPESQFVRGHLPMGISEQFPRFRDDICVQVVGLPQEFDAFVAERIVELAREVKAPVAPGPDCAPNVNVIFTPNPQAQLDDIAKRRDILLGMHFQSQFKRLATVNRPVQAWYVTRTRDTTGSGRIEIAPQTPACPPAGYTGPACERPIGRAGSRLGNDMSAEVVHSLIIADANKVAGQKIDAVADYIAVLALAKWQDIQRCNAIPTILNLMADDCSEAPDAATSADRGLLAGLYSVDPRELGSQQRMSIASRMATEAEKAAAGKPAR